MMGNVRSLTFVRDDKKENVGMTKGEGIEMTFFLALRGSKAILFVIPRERSDEESLN